jgi:hypothetical protein
LATSCNTGSSRRIGPDSFRRNVGLQTGSKTLAMGFQIVLPGAAAAKYVDAFMQNVNWDEVNRRVEDMRVVK